MKKFLVYIGLLLCLFGCQSQPSEEAIQTAIAETEAARTTIKGIEEAAEEIQATQTAAFSAEGAFTPTPSIIDWFLTDVEIIDFHLFEAGEDSSDVTTRNYANTFMQSDARVIYGEFYLSHSGPEQEIPFTIEAVYYDSTGRVYGEVEIHPVIERGGTLSTWTIGYGWDRPGSWGPGKYRIEFLVGGEVIAEDRFEIIQNTPTPWYTATPKATITSTPMPGAVVKTNSLNVRSGPDTVYSIVGSASQGDHLDILGQAYGCAWLKIKMPNGNEGWVSSDLVEYEIPCSDIPSAPVPPTPIPQPAAMPTNTAAPQGKTVSIKIINNTGGTLTLSLSGPASYNFTFAAGTRTIQVLPGTYTYTAWGCGDTMSGTKKLQKGFEWTFYCK